MDSGSKKSFFIFYIIGGAVVLLALYAAFSYWTGSNARIAQEAQAKAAQQDKGPTVQVAVSKMGEPFRRLTLIGEAIPHQQTTVYSKVSGFLRSINVDTGDRVKAGQVLGEIDSLELKQQAASAQAQLANRNRQAGRVRDLQRQGFYSKEAVDQAETDVLVSRAQVAELQAVNAYKTIRAPFDGLVIARYADPGVLLQAATTNQTSSQPIVTVADTSRLKMIVYVEQADAPNVKPGLEVELTDAANPANNLKAKVTRTGGQLDSRTRTLVTEIEFDNSSQKFLAGSFLNVSLLFPTQSYVEVPSAALVARDKKQFVAVLTADNKVQLVPINVANTDGKVLRIAEGLAEGVTVALNLPGTVADGARVNAAPVAQTAGSGAPLGMPAVAATAAPNTTDSTKPADTTGSSKPIEQGVVSPAGDAKAISPATKPAGN